MGRFIIGGDIGQVTFEVLLRLFSELGYIHTKTTLDNFIVFTNLLGVEFVVTDYLGDYLYRCYTYFENKEEVLALAQKLEEVFQENNIRYIIEVEDSHNLNEMTLQLSNWNDSSLH